MTKWTNILTLAKCALFLELKNISDNIEALFWTSRDGLLDMIKLKYFLSHAAVVSVGVA